MRLVLVRHGEAEVALRGVIAGEAGCTGLTERGVRQVEALANRFRSCRELHDCRKLLSSPMAHTWQTAALLGETLSGATIEPDPDLRELLPGAADGLTWQAYEERFGRFSVASSPDRLFAPGGETWSGFTSQGEVHAAAPRGPLPQRTRSLRSRTPGSSWPRSWSRSTSHVLGRTPVSTRHTRH